MESINEVLEDISKSNTEKLNKLNVLLDTKLEKLKENINTNIWNIDTEDTNLKYEVLRKTFFIASNFKENIQHFIGYFKKAYVNLKEHKLLAKFLTFIFNIEDQNQVTSILEQLDIKILNKVLLNEEFLQEDIRESESIFKIYLKYLSADYQAMFLSQIFEVPEIHQKMDFIFLTLKNIDEGALTHDKSVLRNQRFWIYLTNCMVASKDYASTTIVISIVQLCIHFVKDLKLELKFASMEGDGNAWTVFFTFMHVSTFGISELILSSLQLLRYVSSLHYFWQHSVYKLIIRHTPSRLKCTVLASILKQRIEDKDISIFFELILSAINEQNCKDDECAVFTELNGFCEKTKVKNLPSILDEMLNVHWNGLLAWNVFGNVLVESKKNLIDFKYFSCIITHLEKLNTWGYPNLRMQQLLTFFCDPDNLDFWRHIRRSSIPFNTYDLPVPDKLKNIAIPKLIELSNENSDDLLDIEMYLGFLKDNITSTDLIKEYSVSIHVRLVTYRKLFNMNGYITAEMKLDREKTVNDFHEYLLVHLNEKTYVTYRGLMLRFLDLNDRFMCFLYPEKACSEFLNIILNPEIHTKYQICCTTEILRYTYFRFNVLANPQGEFYKKIAHKWKKFVFETEDPEICKQGLYFVLEKGQLNVEEFNRIVKKLLDQHFCDDVTEEIYSKYLNVDLLNFALKRLNDLMEFNIEIYERFAKLFCEAVVSEKFVNNDNCGIKNDEFMFCCHTTKNLEYSIRQIYNCSDYYKSRERTIDLIIEIYLNKLINIETKVECLGALMEFASRNSYPLMPTQLNECFKKELKWIMNRFKEKYAENLKNEINKLRIAQALFVLIPYVMRDLDDKLKEHRRKPSYISKAIIYKKLRNSLRRIVVGILVKESENGNNSVIQICQLSYILLFQHDGTFEEIKRILEKVKERPDLASSFMPILYHVMSFCKFSENEIEQLFEYMFLLSLTLDDKLKIYTQILLQRLYILYSHEEFRTLIEKYISRLERVDLDVRSNKNLIVEILNTNYLFIKVLDPVRDHALETILYILPKLNQVDSVEWEDVMKHHTISYSSVKEFTVQNDENETLNKSVEEFLKRPDQENEYENYSVDDILKIFGMSFENR